MPSFHGSCSACRDDKPHRRQGKSTGWLFPGAVALRSLIVAAVCGGLAIFCGSVRAEDPLRITVQTSNFHQKFEGLGAGVIFYEQHITSLDARQKNERQEQLYDDMFARVPTQFLQLMIREIHEPQNDNDDPWKPAFDEKNFDYCRHTLQIAKAALKRRPEMQFCATLYTPPPWMKTNNDPSGGGESRATLKAGLELELAEYIWGFLAHMQRNGVTIQFLNIANESDWPHTQPGYPPRDSGEALIHVDWGNDYTLTKPYHVFRQWAEPLTPGMHVAGISLAGPGIGRDGSHAGVKPTAFVADDGQLVVHVVNVQDKPAAIALKLTGKLATATAAARIRTSAEEDVAPLAALRSVGGSFADKLPARSLVTYRFDAPDK